MNLEIFKKKKVLVAIGAFILLVISMFAEPKQVEQYRDALNAFLMILVAMGIVTDSNKNNTPKF